MQNDIDFPCSESWRGYYQETLYGEYLPRPTREIRDYRDLPKQAPDVQALMQEIDRINERISNTANNQTVFALKHLVSKLLERVNYLTKKNDTSY